jgi:CelD/BcsL family acetyltransferase involved in cellulose biosynthesis
MMQLRGYPPKIPELWEIPHPARRPPLEPDLSKATLPPVETRHFSVRVVNNWRALEALIPDWEELAQNALEPAPAAESWILIPAMRNELPGNEVRVALISASNATSSGHDGTLCGVFPFEARARFRGFPTRVVRIWNHLYSPGSAPLVRRGCGPPCIRAFFDWVRNEQPAQTIIQFPDLRVESEFFRVLTETLRQDKRAHYIADAWVRAMFAPKASAARYIDSIGSAHHRKEWRRQERRLSEMGVLSYDLLGPGEDVQTWIEEFVALEMSGWKGKQGSGLGCNPRHRAWLNEVVTAASERGRLMMLALRLNGKAIAMKLNLLAPPGSYASRIAFDETLLRFSPGVLLELENIRRLHTMTEIEWMDSLATANHPLMDRVWSGRAAMVSLLVAPGPFVGRLLLASIPLLRTLKRLFNRGRRSVDAVPSP